MNSLILVLIQKVRNKLLRPVHLLRDRAFCSYEESPYDAQERVRTLLPKGWASAVPVALRIPPEVADLYLGHFFDLLGSGWISVGPEQSASGFGFQRYSSTPSGPHCRPNILESARLSGFIRGDYKKIDWHRDSKSGFRWDAALWSRSIQIGSPPGADIKFPWELARMQHLPQLALAAAGDSEKCNRFALEFENEFFDFHSANPPRFGANWVCTMDVAIRVANWLLAYDIFCSAGHEFSAAFHREFARSVYQHGRHIYGNLEWHRKLRTNHYLANLSGLLFVCAYLPPGPETSRWQRFAQKNFLAEAVAQFHEEGSNFEGSSSYHRLSAEMLVYGCAILVKLGEGESITAEVRGRLGGLASFTELLTKPNGNILQIGDNDSGRFFKLEPSFLKTTVARARKKYLNLVNYQGLAEREDFWDENVLDHRHIGNALSGFSEGVATGVDGLLVNAYARGESFFIRQAMPSPMQAALGEEVAFEMPASPNAILTRIPLGNHSRDFERYAYSQFGIYLIRGQDFFLSIRCGSLGQNGFGGHSHNDQLSVELFMGGREWIVDPGTFIYTPDRSARDKFRSAHSHFGPHVPGLEPGDLSKDFFLLDDKSKAKPLYFGPRGFLGVHFGYGDPVYRKIAFTSTHIEITDFSPGKLNLQPPPVPEFFSAGYGKIEKNISPLGEREDK